MIIVVHGYLQRSGGCGPSYFRFYWSPSSPSWLIGFQESPESKQELQYFYSYMTREWKKVLNGYIYFQVLDNNVLIEKNSHKISMQRNLKDEMDEGGRELKGWEDIV